MFRIPVRVQRDVATDVPEVKRKHGTYSKCERNYEVGHRPPVICDGRNGLGGGLRDTQIEKRKLTGRNVRHRCPSSKPVLPQ